MLNCEKFKENHAEIPLALDGWQFTADGVKSCGINMVKWLMSEYKEPKLVVDWTKVPIDTPVICYSERGIKFKRHFAGIDGKLPATFVYGQTSWSEDKVPNSKWDRVELAEPHPEWMKCVEEES